MDPNRIQHTGVKRLPPPPAIRQIAAPIPARPITASRRLPLPPEFSTREGASFTVDAAGTVYVWCILNPERGFLRFGGDTVMHLPIPEATSINTTLAPFVDGRLLVWVYQYDRNAPDCTVYSPSGEKLSSFRLRDSPTTAQITASGQIWWGGYDQSEETMLDCINSDGEYLFRYYPFCVENNLPPIADCYALNVCADNEVWAYYYTDFPLVRLKDFQLAGRWDLSHLPGIHAFAVDGERVLFAGRNAERDTRGQRSEGRDQHKLLYLLTLATGKVERLRLVHDAADGAGPPEPVDVQELPCLGRGACLYLSDGQAIDVVDLTRLP